MGFKDTACKWVGWVLAWLLMAAISPALANDIVEARQARVLLSDEESPPSLTDPRWQSTALPALAQNQSMWVLISFEGPVGTGPGSIYLPYLYGGGKAWLNGQFVGAVNQSTPGRRVRWERPHLLTLPTEIVQPGLNWLHIHTSPASEIDRAFVPRLSVGPTDQLQSSYDRRMFLARTVPFITITLCFAAGLGALLIAGVQRDERAYMFFGLMALCWGLRSTTFTMDTWSSEWWGTWRTLYYVGTGGMVVFLCLFAMTLAKWRPTWLGWLLLCYWAAGPTLFLVGGDALADRLWVSALPLVGTIAVAAIGWAVWSTRQLPQVVIGLSVLAAFCAGVHDLLLARGHPWLLQGAPDWAAHRIFMLHHAANLMVLVMGGTLLARYVSTARAVELAHATLEERVRVRESELQENYLRITSLEREQAVLDERQRILQELHDGLGSQLFAGLAKAERGGLEAPAIADLLRECISEMRLAIDTLTSSEEDFIAVFGSFRYRWEPRLREFGLLSQWRFDVPEVPPRVPPVVALHILRVAQEALTNVLKHAKARCVEVDLTVRTHEITLRVRDDGLGLPEASSGGHGHRNMRARAQRLGASLTFSPSQPGTQVMLTTPLGAADPQRSHP